jgi:ubiquinone/menaquinone biosynthesis C-methylase UbiE
MVVQMKEGFRKMEKSKSKEEINALVEKWSNQEWSTNYSNTFMRMEEILPFDKLLKANSYRFIWVKKKSKGVGPALDIGCGNGVLAQHLTEIGHEVTGVDVSDEIIQTAQKNVPKAKFVNAFMDKLPFEDESFNMVSCLELIEHVPNLHECLMEAVRVCKTGGQLFFTTPVDRAYDCNLHVRHFKWYDVEEAFNKLPIKSYKIYKIFKAGPSVEEERLLFGVEVIK